MHDDNGRGKPIYSAMRGRKALHDVFFYGKVKRAIGLKMPFPRWISQMGNLAK